MLSVSGNVVTDLFSGTPEFAARCLTEWWECMEGKTSGSGGISGQCHDRLGLLYQMTLAALSKPVNLCIHWLSLHICWLSTLFTLFRAKRSDKQGLVMEKIKSF